MRHYRLVDGRRGDVLALAAGAALPLAFAPVGWFWLAWICPALLFATWQFADTRQAFLRGWLFGLGMFGVGISWIYVAVHEFGNTGMLVAGLLTGGFVAFLALFPALLGWCAARFITVRHDRGQKLLLLLVLPSGWTLFEWIRSWILTGFPWLSLGYSQIDAPLAGLAPSVGVYGVSWATAFSAALLVLLGCGGARARWRAVGLLVALWGVALALAPLKWTAPAGRLLHVTLIQGNIPQAVKWQSETRTASLDLYADLTRGNWSSDLIVWPEGAVPVLYQDVAENYLAPLADEARSHHTDILLGIPVQDPDSGHYYNSMISLGSNQGVYFKRHLVPFGDYVPLQGWLRGLIGFFNLPMSSFSAGPENQPLLEVAGQKVDISICYEDVFGEEVIRGLPEARLLVNATNNAWYGDSFAPPQHLQISRMRSLETGRTSLRATTNGISAIIDYKGKIETRSPQFKTWVLHGVAQPRTGATPYVQFGNAPVLVWLTLTLAAAFLLTGRCRRRGRAASGTAGSTA